MWKYFTLRKQEYRREEKRETETFSNNFLLFIYKDLKQFLFKLAMKIQKEKYHVQTFTKQV